MVTATLNKLAGINSTGGIVRQMRIITQSDTLVAPTDGQLLILAVAAGASGAVLNSTTATQRLATGGGAGEAVFDVIEVTKNDTFTATLGAPGAAVGPGVAPFSSNGNNAANLTLTGPNSYSMSAEGGKAGVAATGSATAAGGAGGTAGTGGTARVIRAPGGRAGTVSGAAGSAMIATGGGGVNAMMRTAQTATRGGDSTSTSTTATIATGGGAPGGRAGDRTGTSTGATGGAGAGGNGTDNALTAGPNIRGSATQASPADLFGALATYGIDYFGGGTPGDSTLTPGGGGATGGRVNGAGSLAVAGIFAAAGAICAPTNGTTVTADTPGFGAGSPGMVGSGVSTTLTSKAGGQAILVAIFIEN